MKFTFTDKKVNIPNRVHTYAEKKIGKLDRYFQTEPETSIVFSVEKGRNNLEVTIRSGSTVIRVAESTSDMFVSIDAAVASIERQLRKNKTRLEKRLRKDAFDAYPEESYFIPESDEEEEPSYQLVRTKRFFFRPMSIDEAILQMNLVNHTFFAFRNEDAAVASIERQLRKNKTRLEKRLRKDAFDAYPEESYFIPESDEEEEPSYQLVRTKRFFFRPMSIDEAILQMNLVNHTFFAFRNEDDGGAFSVVYKRKDGGYGIIVDQD